MWIFPATAGLISGIFAVMLARDWLARRRAHLAAWALALAMFSIASLAAAGGMVAEWTPAWFKTYYLFGAIINVPVLALGTIYLLGPRALGHGLALAVVAACIVAAVVVVGASVRLAALETSGIPSGREAVSDSVRSLSRYYSFAGFFVVVGGALLSAWRLTRSRLEHLRSLAIGNILIASGTAIVAVGSALARRGQGVPFSMGLLLGVATMFLGFLKTKPRGGSR